MTIQQLFRAAVGAILLGGLGGSFAFSQPFRMTDVHYWVGTGTNQAVVLIDFNLLGRPRGLLHSKAYGIRWNGEISQLEALKQIDHDDRRLTMVYQNGSYGAFLTGFGYDVDGDGGYFDVTSGETSDEDDIFLSSEAATTWNFSWQTAVHTGTDFLETFEYGDFQMCPSGVSFEKMMPNSLFAVFFLPWGDTTGTWSAPYDADWNPLPFEYPETGDWVDYVPSFPEPAESPYGYRVVSYQSEMDVAFSDGFTRSEAALGRPACQGASQQSMIGDSDGVPMTPFVVASGRDQVVRLLDTVDEFGELDRVGSITIAFDHPVVDDPFNPWGLDFIVFGNAMYAGTSDGRYLTGREDPATVRIQSAVGATASLSSEEPGRVSVSQDGVHWYTFAQGPFADSFAPTMGYRLEPEFANTNLFRGNRWWGRPTDATYPVPPVAMAAIRHGTSLEQLAMAYHGSAGGTAFDIGMLDLPATHRGLKWIQYVRIENHAPEDDPMSSCEIDAVSDVAPDTPFGCYLKSRYAWENLPVQGAPNAVASNGRENALNFVLGEASETHFKITRFEQLDGRLWFTFPVWKTAWCLDDIRASGMDVAVRSSSRLTADGPTGKGLGKARFECYESTDEQCGNVTLSVPMPTAKQGFFRLGVVFDDVP